MSRLSNFFKEYFNLDDDREDEAAIVESITRNIHFRGVNLWTLIFAIIVASVGLNVNATAVIIGAMLISPLMGPIMGVGLGIGINDFDLVRKGFINLFFAVVASILTSTIYFLITPLHGVTSELLARTTPTIWDVLIAFAGGLAGIVAGTRREKSNVIPGVAIATALMPPLCTAGFGLATGHVYYFLGALYLFFINSVFICIATVLIVRYLNFNKREFESKAREKRVTTYILLVVIITVAPSIWLAYRIVQKAVFEKAAQNFVSSEFNFPNTQVIGKTFLFDQNHPKIELLLIGRTLDSLEIDTLKNHLAGYHLKDSKLIIRQGLDARQQIDFVQVKASILDEVFKDADTTTAPTPKAEVVPKPIPDLHAEINTLFPQITSYTIAFLQYTRTDSLKRTDSVMAFVANGSLRMKISDQVRLRQWLKKRLELDSVQVMYRRSH